MTDYRCPSCDGGFPADDHDDACPWCGEAMDAATPPASSFDPVPPSDMNTGPLSLENVPRQHRGRVRPGTADEVLGGEYE